MTQSRYSLMSEAYRSMYEGSLKQARRNIGMNPDKPSCWDGYKAKGTKMKGGRSVPNCVKEDYINYLINHRFAIDEVSAEAIYDHMSDKWKMMIEDRIEEGVLDTALKSDKEMGKLINDTDEDVKRVRKGGKFNYGDKNMKNESAEDGLRDMRQESGVDGNTNYDKPPKPNKNMGGGKPQAGPNAALDAVKKMMKGKLM